MLVYGFNFSDKFYHLLNGSSCFQITRKSNQTAHRVQRKKGALSQATARAREQNVAVHS